MQTSFISICIITYNHEKYIKDAIEGIINQKCEFSIEIVIGDDHSTDKTRNICQEYANQYANKIKILPSKKNLGVIPNFIRTLQACNGKYIAICEGDDFWTDRLKLQKQIDFLEKNQNFSLCFHNSLITHQKKKENHILFCNEDTPAISSTVDLLHKFYIPTASIVFRNSALDLPSWFPHIYNGDYALSLILSLKGKIKYLNDIMSVYRKNEGGLNAMIKDSFIWHQKIELLTYFDFYTEFEFHNQIQRRKIELIDQIPSLLENEKRKIEKLFTLAHYKKIFKKTFNF